MQHPEFVAIDFETTGAVAGFPVEPWQVGAVRVQNAEIVAQWESLIFVEERPFHPKAPGRHDLLRKEISAAPTAGELLPELWEFCRGVPLVAHNVATEQKCVRHLAPMHAFGPWIDSLVLARKVWPELRSFRLGELMRSFGQEALLQSYFRGRDYHDALYDAGASALLLLHVLDQPGWKQQIFSN